MKKILSLVLVLVMVLSSIPAFADVNTAGERLEDLGIIQGDGTGLNPGAELKRQNAIIILTRMLGLEEEALATTVKPSFTDIPEADLAFYGPYIAFAEVEKLTKGVGGGLFGWDQEATTGMMATFMVRALGYEAETIADGLKKAVELEIVAEDAAADAVITRGETFVQMSKTLDLTPVGEEKALVYVLELEEEPVVEAFTATNVTADSLKSAFVNFTGEVVAKTVTATNLKVQVNGAAALTVDTDLTDGVADDKVGYIVDGETVQIVFGKNHELSQSDEIKVTVENVENADAAKVEKVVLEVVAKDITAPEVVSVVAENAKTIKVTFSEPVNYTDLGAKVFSNVMIDDAKLVGTASISADKTVVTYALNAKLAANTYTVTTASVKDFAGFVAPSVEQTITVVADDAAPKVVSAEATNKNTVVVTFDENIDQNAGSITIDGTKYDLASAAVVVSGAKATITLTADLVASDAFVDVKGSYTGIKDVLGNEEKSSPAPTFTFKAPFDEVAPTATVEVKADNTIVVTFSEAVTGVAADAYTLVDANKATVASTIAAKAGSTGVYIITLDEANVDVVTYTLKINNKVTDLSVIANKFTETEFSVTMNDKKAPTVSGNVTVVAANKVRVTFSEAMDTATLANLDNYLWSDAGATAKTLSTVSKAAATVAADGKSVDLTIPGVDTSDSIYLLNLKDVAGTLIANYNTMLAVNAAATFTEADIVATLKSTTTIELKATGHEFTIVNPNEIKVYENGVVSATHYVTSAVVDAKDASKVVLTLNMAVKPNGTYGAGNITLVIDGTDTKDTFGTTLEVATESLVDGVAATVAISSTTAGNLVLTFDEAVNTTDASLFINDVLLRDKDGKLVDLAGKVAVIEGTNWTNFTKVEITGLTSDDTYTVEVLSRNIKDLAGNVVNTLASTSQKIK